MNIFPIKIEKAVEADMKFIEWKIHNVCNHNCGFCGAEHKDGSQRWLTLEKYKQHIDKLAKVCEGAPYWIQITGGEPTLMPDLVELLRYIKNKGAYVSMISNGTRTIRWWKELKEEKLLDYLFLTYHSEQTDDYQHIAEIINLFHEEPIEVICLITHEINSIDKAFEAREYFLKNTGSIITLKAMMIGSYDIYKLYTKEQLDVVKKSNWEPGANRSTKARTTIEPKYRINHAVRMTYNVGFSHIVDPQILMKNQKNKFYGWDCDIGNNTIRIDSETIYRGVCGVGGSTSLNDEVVQFKSDYITCTSAQCFCGTDMVSTKVLPKSMYPSDPAINK